MPLQNLIRREAVLHTEGQNPEAKMSCLSSVKIIIHIFTKTSKFWDLDASSEGVELLGD